MWSALIYVSSWDQGDQIWVATVSVDLSKHVCWSINIFILIRGGVGGGVYFGDNVIYCHTENWPRDTTQHDKHQITWVCVNTLRPRQNGLHSADDTFKCIFFNKNVGISIKISLKFVPKGPINNIPALVQVMAWRRPGDKPLTEPMVVRLLTHICVTRPQWVKC